MSNRKYLLDSQPLIILPELAFFIGLNEAIILQQIHYWLEINKKAKKNYQGGHYWTYNTIDEWHKQFKFWSRNTIKRTITSLENANLLISDNFNKTKMDHTKWYRIDYAALDKITSNIVYLDTGYDPDLAEDIRQHEQEVFARVENDMIEKDIKKWRKK